MESVRKTLKYLICYHIMSTSTIESESQMYALRDIITVIIISRTHNWLKIKNWKISLPAPVFPTLRLQIASLTHLSKVQSPGNSNKRCNNCNFSHKITITHLYSLSNTLCVYKHFPDARTTRTTSQRCIIRPCTYFLASHNRDSNCFSRTDTRVMRQK